MKRIFKTAAVSILGLGLTAGVLPAQSPYYGNTRGDDRYQSAEWHDRDRGYSNYREDSHDRGYRDDGRYYRNGYYDRDHNAGRSVAIIGGGAAAGALIGAAAGHGEGAAIGAVVGGIAGFVAEEAVRHNDHRR